MEEEYKDWYKSWKNHLLTFGAITSVSLGVSLYGYKNLKEIDNSLTNHSLELTNHCLEKSVVTSLKDEKELYKSMITVGGYVGFLSLVLGMGVLGACPGDP